MESVRVSDVTMKLMARRGDNPLSFKGKLEIAKLLDRLGVSVIELEGLGASKADALRIRSISSAVKNSVVAVPVELDPDSVCAVWETLKEAKHPRLQVTAPVSTVQMEYLSGKKPAEIYPALVEHWKAHREAEIASCSCLSGAHKDDIELTLDGLPARTYASQGQARTAALALKLAERDISAADTGSPPVMLLDDVLSELDSRRQDFVLNSIAGGQVLITCCVDGGISSRTGGKVLTVENGKVY